MKFLIAVLLCTFASLQAAPSNPLGFGGRPLAVSTNLEYNLKDYATNGTDITLTLSNLIVSGASTGRGIRAPEGTWIISSLTNSNPVLINFDNGAIFLHATNATGHMIHQTGGYLRMTGPGILDGNKDNQASISTNFHALIYAKDPFIDGPTFRNFMQAGILDEQSQTNATYKNLTFINPKMVPTNNPPPAVFAITTALEVTNKTVHFHSENIRLKYEPETAPTRSAGGIYLAGNRTLNTWIEATHSGYLEYENVGESDGSGGTGGPVYDAYEDVLSLTGGGMVGTNAGYALLKLNGASHVRWDGIKGHTTDTQAILVYPGERLNTNARPNQVIENFRIYGDISTTYLLLAAAGQSGGYRDITLRNGWGTNLLFIAQTEGYDDSGGVVLDGDSRLTIDNVVAWGANGVKLFGLGSSEAHIKNSQLHASVGTVLTATQTNQLATLRLTDNKWYGQMLMRGVGTIIGRGNIISNASASVALNFEDDADGNNIGYLAWSADNRVISGTTSVTLADIDAGYRWEGNVLTIYPTGATFGQGSPYRFKITANSAALESIFRLENTNSAGALQMAFAVEDALGTISVYDDTYSDGTLADWFIIRAESNAAGLRLRSVAGPVVVQIPVGQTFDVAMSGTNKLRVNASGNVEGDVLATGSTTARSLQQHVTGDVINLGNYISTNYTGAQNLAGITAAWDYARTIAAVHPRMVAPAGVFLFSDTIEFTNQMNGIKIEGAGKHATYFRADASMDRLFRLGLNGNTFDGRNMVTGITFDGNNQADIVVDFSSQAYSDFWDNEVIQPAAGGTCILAGQWINTFFGNIIHGDGIGMGLVLTNQPFNGFNIVNNEFMFCTIPLVVPAGLQDMHIELNDFEGCAGPIWFQGGAYNLTFERNYIEASGLTNPVPVEVSAGVFSNYYGAVVFSHLYNAVTDTTYRNLIVRGNTYANNSPSAMLTIDNVIGGHISDDFIYPTYTHTNYVHLRGKGSPYTTSRGLTIDYTDVGDSVTTPIGFNYLDDREQGSAGLKIQTRDKVAYATFPKIGGSVWGNPASWQQFGTTGTISVGRDGLFEGYKVWKAERSSGSDYYFFKIFTNDTTGSISSIDGHRYVRIQYATKGDVGAANGLQVSAIIDGVTQVISDRTSETWRAAENLIVHLPPGVTTFQIAATPVNSTDPCWFTKFTIEDASAEFGVGEVLTELDYFTSTAVVPTYGAWTTGDKVFFKAASADGYIGAICTATGSPGTWVQFGPTKTVLDTKITKTAGTATLVGGTVTVNTAAVTANSLIFLTVNTAGGTVGSPYVSARVASTSFDITSTSGTDTSTVAWMLFEP